RPMSQSTRRFGRATPTICCWSPSEPPGSLGQHLKKRLRCCRGTDLGAVDEVHKAVGAAHRRETEEARRPGLQSVGRITGGLILGATPQAGVDEIAGQLFE